MSASLRAKRAEIKLRYDAHERELRRQGKLPPTMSALRVAEINRIFEARYGPQLPNDDAGIADASIMINYLAQLKDPEHRILDWAAAKAPWLPIAKALFLARQAIADPRRWAADTLAAKLNLTFEERQRLGIKTIGATDLSKEQRIERRKALKRQRERDRRKARRQARAQ